MNHLYSAIIKAAARPYRHVVNSGVITDVDWDMVQNDVWTEQNSAFPEMQRLGMYHPNQNSFWDAFDDQCAKVENFLDAIQYKEESLLNAFPETWRLSSQYVQTVAEREFHAKNTWGTK